MQEIKQGCLKLGKKKNMKGETETGHSLLEQIGKN